MVAIPTISVLWVAAANGAGSTAGFKCLYGCDFRWRLTQGRIPRLDDGRYPSGDDVKTAFAVTSLAVLIALIANPLEAQEVERRRGFRVSVGLGAGVSTADAAADESRWGGAGYLRAGGVPDGHVVLGTEFIGWVTGQDDVSTSRGAVTLFVQYYPSTTGGLFFKGGLGRAGAAVTTDLNPGKFVTSTDGFGMTLGSGYEFRLSRVTSFTVNADWVLQVLDDQASGSVSSSLFLLTIGLTFPRIG